jgi:cytochrome c-type biogenesis protein CcmH
MSGLSRRDFLGRLGALAAVPVALQTQDSLAGRGADGTLRDPTAVGRPREVTRIEDYDERIKSIEHRLACNCGCTLDVFTCRTTDFTCTYSPKLHREVVAMDKAEMSADQILDAFVREYGEKALMAPKPEGFNLWGYLLPGSLIVAAGAGLFAFIGRRKVALVGPGTAESGASPDIAPARNGSPEEMERLRRALAEVDD